jgi:5-methylcytosine-specific restriction endonuclease McrA
MAQEYARAFYNSKAWQRCRDNFMLSKIYQCERCGGIAAIAHHKTHITPGNINDPAVTLSWDNLQALCTDCHNKVHGNTAATAKGISFDAAGNVVYTPPC